MIRRAMLAILAATAAGVVLGYVYDWFRETRSEFWHADVSQYSDLDLCDDCGPDCPGGLISD